MIDEANNSTDLILRHAKQRRSLTKLRTLEMFRKLDYKEADSVFRGLLDRLAN